MTDLAVLIDGRPAATLTRGDGGKLSLSYLPEWRQSVDAVPLSLSLPLTSNSHRHKTIVNYLWGLLFERKPVLEALAIANDISIEDVFGLAALRGEDLPGAVSIAPPDKMDNLRKREGVKQIGEAQLSKFLKELRGGRTALGITDGASHFSLAGVQPKKALCLINGKWYEPRGSTPSTHIIKPAMPDFEDVVEVEHFCLRLADKLGLTVAKSSVLYLDDQAYFVAERFDRVRLKKTVRVPLTEPDGIIARIHQEDMCQALGLHPEKKYQSMNGPSMRNIMQLLKGSERAAVDRERFMRACAFNFVLGCPDAHAKNYSILHNPGGTFRLAPLYDVISVLPYDTDKYKHLAMYVDGEREWKNIKPKDWEREAQACGFNPKTALRLVSEIFREAPKAAKVVLAECTTAGIRPDILKSFTSAIAKRCKELRMDYE
jgi:serine/threonine-protein kinase HipA